MRKITPLLFILYYTTALGQSYTATVYFQGFPASSCSSSCICNTSNYTWQLLNGSTILNSGSLASTTYKSSIITNIAIKSSYNLVINNNCVSASSSSYCNSNPSTGTIAENNIMCSILNSCAAITLTNCAGYVSFQEFKPIGLSVSTFKPWTPIYNSNGMQIGSTFPEICSGEDIQLYATPGVAPNKFPIGVYHWQYSLDNKVTWIDVPSEFGVPYGTTNKFNFTPTPTLTMENILGAEHENYFGKEINFRLGYSNGFTNPMTIKYSPCAPILKDRTYLPPDCYGDAVKSIVVYFDRKLETNESLYPFQIIPYPKKNGDSPKFSQSPITELVFDTNTGWYKYSFINTDNEKLENRYYNIEYQARILNKNYIADPILNPDEVGKYILKGVLQSSKEFLYEDPTPFHFTATATPAICNGAKGAIEILAWGGSGTYKYKLDGGTETAFTMPAVFDQIETTKQKIVIPADSKPNPNPLILNNHSILVSDSKGCIDKTAND